MKEFIRYTSVSVVALMFDYLTYLFMLGAGEIDPPTAAVIGYAVGLFVAYYLLVRYVFFSRWLSRDRRKEFVLFVASGFIGLATTYYTVNACVEDAGFDPVNSKNIAVIISFLVVYAFRKTIVFRRVQF